LSNRHWFRRHSTNAALGLARVHETAIVRSARWRGVVTANRTSLPLARRGRRREDRRDLLPQLVEQRLRLLQIERVEALGEGRVKRGEERVSLGRTIAGLKPPPEACRGTQLHQLGAEAVRERDRLLVARLDRRRGCPSGSSDLAAQA